MAVALEVCKFERSQRLSLSIVLRPFLWIRAWVYRLWWHTHAYTTIFAITVLTLLSLIGLYLHHLVERRQSSLKSSNKVEEGLPI